MKTLSLIILLCLNYGLYGQTLGNVLEGADGLVHEIKARHWFSANLSANGDHTHDANNKISTVIELGGWTMSSGVGVISLGSFQLDSAAAALIAPAINIDATTLFDLDVGASNESSFTMLDDNITINQDAGEIEITGLDRDDAEDDIVGISSGSGKIVLKRASNIATQTPASAGAAGQAGDIAYDGTYIYICINTNTWRRILHATW